MGAPTKIVAREIVPAPDKHCGLCQHGRFQDGQGVTPGRCDAPTPMSTIDCVQVAIYPDEDAAECPCYQAKDKP